MKSDSDIDALGYHLRSFMSTSTIIPVTSREYRHTIGLFATGVAVIATTSDDIYAMTVNTLTSVSLDPLLLLVCVHKEAQLMEYLHQYPNFSINILSKEQTDLSQYFANMWSGDKPAYCFSPWIDQAPYLEDSIAALACHTYKIIEGGDHWVVMGEVVGLRQQQEVAKPLLFYKGQYAKLCAS